MSIPNPNPNIADGVKCDNKTYSSNKIESLITAATELPIPEAGDAGKVLAVNSGETGYELDSLSTVATTGSYNDLTDKPTIPILPDAEVIDKDDFFVDATNVSDFYAYRYGKIIVIDRLVILNTSYSSSDTTHVTIKSDYRPAANSIRVLVDDGASVNTMRAWIEGGALITTTASDSTSLFMYAASYYIN